MKINWIIFMVQLLYLTKPILIIIYIFLIYHIIKTILHNKVKARKQSIRTTLNLYILVKYLTWLTNPWKWTLYKLELGPGGELLCFGRLLTLNDHTSQVMRAFIGAANWKQGPPRQGLHLQCSPKCYRYTQPTISIRRLRAERDIGLYCMESCSECRQQSGSMDTDCQELAP